MRCERCLKACRSDAIYFERSVRLVDYAKCKGCLSCVQVCPRNAIQVTSVILHQVLTVKIDRTKCTMCEQCLEEDGKFCPQNLFCMDKVKKDGEEMDGILYNFNEVAKCQGCLKCESSCPEGAIKPVVYNADSFN